MKLNEAIGKRVQNLLKERNLKPYWLFKNGGIARSTISDIINNNKGRVSTKTIYEICSTLGITLGEFFTDPLFDEVDD